MNSRKWQRVNRLRQRYTPLFEKRLKRIFAQQGRIIIEALKHLRPEDVIPMVSTLIKEEPLRKYFKSLYENVGVAFAKTAHRDLKQEAKIIETKQDEELESRWIEEMLRYAEMDAGKRIVSITGSSKNIARKILSEQFAEGIEQGLSIEEMTAKITTEFRMQWGKFAMFRARRIVETEILAASNLGAMEGARSVGIPMIKVWMAGGANIRDYDNGSPFSHVAADGEQVSMEDDFIKSGEPMDCPGDPKGSPGNVINCYTGDMNIKSDIVGAQRSFYSGEIIEIITVGGKRLTITPNHNIFTKDGIIRACDIKPGYDLVCDTTNVNWIIRLINNYINNKKSLITNAFNSLQRLWGSKKIMITELDFDGDGRFMDKQIDIINPNIELSINAKIFAKNFGKFIFKHTRPKASLIKRFCSLNFGFNRVICSPNSLMCMFNLILSFSKSHFRPMKFFSLRTSSYHYPIFNEIASKGSSCDSKFISELFNTYPGFIHLDKVSKIRNYKFFGHVYDFTSLSGTNIVNNIYTTNCKCAVAHMPMPGGY